MQVMPADCFGFPLKHLMLFTFRVRMVKGIKFGNCSLIFSSSMFSDVSVTNFHSVYRSGQYLVSRYDTAVSVGLSSAPGQKVWLCWQGYNSDLIYPVNTELISMSLATCYMVTQLLLGLEMQTPGAHVNSQHTIMQRELQPSPPLSGTGTRVYRSFMLPKWQ